MTRTSIKYVAGERVSTEVSEAPASEPEPIRTRPTPLAELAKAYEKKPSKNREAKKDRFQRLASKRTQVVLDKIRVLGNCASRGQYEWTHEEALKILNEIKLAVSDLEEKLTSEPKGRKKFSF